jgi:hypothetical protein
VVFCGVKAAEGGKDDHSSPSTAETKDGGVTPPLPILPSENSAQSCASKVTLVETLSSTTLIGKSFQVFPSCSRRSLVEYYFRFVR